MRRDTGSRIASAHDAMSGEYDFVDDPWYTHLFATIHSELLLAIRSVTATQSHQLALDVGCGTGLQSWLLAEAGFDVTGFDLSDGLLQVARSKAFNAPTWNQSIAFDRNMQKAHSEAMHIRGQRARGLVRFFRGDAEDSHSYTGGPFAIINCVGSVLSFVDDPDATLQLLREACSPDGRIILECEMKANLDTLWPLVDLLVGGRLHYDTNWRSAISNATNFQARDSHIVYPFDLKDSGRVELPMRLFSHRLLAQRFAKAGLSPVRKRSIHCVTNIFPSPTLHSPLSPLMSAVYSGLEHIDRKLGTCWPFNRLGCSSIFILKRT
jgi:SAM-dependent methyltransferase